MLFSVHDFAKCLPYDFLLVNNSYICSNSHHLRVLLIFLCLLFKVILGHQNWYQWKAHIGLPISE